MRTVGAFVAFAGLLAPFASGGPDDRAIWESFSRAFREGSITAQRLRPYPQVPRETLLRFTDAIRRQAKPEDWQAEPEVHRVGDQVHFLISLTTDGGKKTFCFTVLEQHGEWFFQHVESIFIRLDRTGSPPVSTFPDLGEDQKRWMREEIAMTERLRVFNLLAREKGKPFAFEWFKDGAGYLLAARTWVPFLPAARAFVLYACWEQSNLRGSAVTLTSLDDEHAVVDLDAVDWRLYDQTAHISQMISRADYRALFEMIWQDRAAAAGWKLAIEYHGTKVRLRFEKSAPGALSAICPPAPTNYAGRSEQSGQGVRIRFAGRQ
jgi:hypothetical protein